MELEDAVEEQRRYRLEVVVLAAIVVTAIVALVVTLVVRTAGNEPPAPTATLVNEATPEVHGEPRLAGPTDLRSAPASNVAIVTRLAQTDVITILGRSADAEWLAVTLADRPQVAGWVRAEAVLDPPDGLPVIAAPGAGSIPPGTSPTFTPDLPDLVVVDAFGIGNVLHVQVHNQGAGDATGTLSVSVNDGTPVELDLKGVPLHPGQTAIAAVPGEYLQLRAQFTLLLIVQDAPQEEDAENNGWAGIVEPDQPNDMEITGARAAEGGTHLIVTVRNNSPIPITGPFTVSVREALPSTTLLGRHNEMRTIAVGESIDLPFPEVTDPDLTRIAISISTTAIADATLENNTYPR